LPKTVGGTGGASDMKRWRVPKDPKVTGGLVSKFPHPRVNKTHPRAPGRASNYKRSVQCDNSPTSWSSNQLLRELWRQRRMKRTIDLSARPYASCRLPHTCDTAVLNELPSTRQLQSTNPASSATLLNLSFRSRFCKTSAWTVFAAKEKGVEK
jgi:hypothetical protein